MAKRITKEEKEVERAWIGYISSFHDDFVAAFDIKNYGWEYAKSEFVNLQNGVHVSLDYVMEWTGIGSDAKAL